MVIGVSRKPQAYRAGAKFVGYKVDFYHEFHPIQSGTGIGRVKKWKVEYKGILLQNGLKSKVEAVKFIKGLVT